MPKILSIVERAYHGTLEEQDDTILWVTTAIKNAGADLSVLLRANAVNYAVAGQDASGLTIGGVPLRVPPTLDKDVEDLVKKGVAVYAVAEDLATRGIPAASLVPGVKIIPWAQVAPLLDAHQSIWHW